MKKIYWTVFLFAAIVGVCQAETIDAVYYNPSLMGDYNALKVTDKLTVGKDIKVGTNTTNSNSTKVFYGKAQTTTEMTANSYTIGNALEAKNVDMRSTRFVINANAPLQLYAAYSDGEISFEDTSKTSNINLIKGVNNSNVNVNVFANRLVSSTGGQMDITVGKAKTGLKTYAGKGKGTEEKLSKDNNPVMLKLGNVPIRSIQNAQVCKGVTSSGGSATLKWYYRFVGNDAYRVLGCDPNTSTSPPTPSQGTWTYVGVGNSMGYCEHAWYSTTNNCKGTCSPIGSTCTDTLCEDIYEELNYVCE